MKVLLIIFFASGTCFLCNKNKQVKVFVSDLLNLVKQDKKDDSLSKPISNDSTVKQEKKEKIPKTIKPDEFYSLDKHATETPNQYEKDIPTLVQYLTAPIKTDIEKVRVLFTWVALHVKYDDKAFNTDIYPDYTAEYVLKNKKAVCEGYANLLHALCVAAGLESEKLIGYAKGYSYDAGDKFKETNHAWNAVKVDNNWRLFDVTWASGSGTKKNGKLVSKSRFEPFWFDVHPKAFIFTHLPEELKWQLTESQLSLDKYEVLPFLSSSFFELGFNPDEIYAEAVLGKTKEFVETYSPDLPIRIMKFPYFQKLVRGNEITFEIESEYADKIALIDGNSWHLFSKVNNIFKLTHTPKGKSMIICVKTNSLNKNFLTIVKYKLKDYD